MRTILRWLAGQRVVWALVLWPVCLGLRAMALLLRVQRWRRDRLIRRYLRRQGVCL